MSDRSELEDQTKDELQEQLRSRGEPVSGTKDELIERLLELDDDAATERGESDGRGHERIGGNWTDRLSAVRRTVRELTSAEVESFVGVVPLDEGGWQYVVQVVEARRVPSSSDLISIFEVEVDDEGELLALRRTARGTRTQVGTS